MEIKHCKYDKNDIFGKIYLPKNLTPKCPAVILCHGFNAIGDDMGDIAEILRENGVVAYTFDFCGGSTRSKSSGKSVDMSLKTEVCDLLAVIEMIKNLDQVDDEKIYLYSESMGGFVSALTACENNVKIAGLFLCYPAFCIPDQWLKLDIESMGDTFNFMGDMVLSRKFYDDVPRFDVFEYVKSFKNPVVIFQGDCDPVVNLSYSEKLSKSFENAQLHIVKDAQHWFEGDDRKRVISSLVEFVKR